MAISKVDYGGNTLIDLTGDTIVEATLLSGMTAHDKAGNPITGTMTNHGAVDQTLPAGSSYTIPRGYHSGSGKVTADAIPSNYKDVSSVTATAPDVLSGKKFVNSSGTVITGTMTNRGAVNATVAAGSTYTIPSGYHNGSGKVTATGAVVKTASGTATTTVSDGTTYLNIPVSFSPDLVVIYADSIQDTDSDGDPITIEYNATFAFGATNTPGAYADSYAETPNDPNGYTHYLFMDNGYKPNISACQFYVHGVKPTYSRYEGSYLTYTNLSAGKQFRWKAVKYTE